MKMMKTISRAVAVLAVTFSLSASANHAYQLYVYLDGQWYIVGQPVSYDKCQQVASGYQAQGIPATCVAV